MRNARRSERLNASAATLPELLDHLVYAVPDLGAAVDALSARLGVRPDAGGRHPGWGTHNALLSLGGDSYLELIAPDPEQPAPEHPRSFDLDGVTEPLLRTWAIKAPNIDARIERARVAGFDPGDAEPGSRATPDGAMLEWRLARSGRGQGDWLVPFLIDWGDAAHHPSRTAPAGCSLVELRAVHPDPEAIQPMLDAVGAELAVERGDRPALIATLDTPRGRVELR